MQTMNHRFAAIKSLVACDPTNAIARLSEFQPTPLEMKFATELLEAMKGKAHRYIPAKFQGESFK